MVKLIVILCSLLSVVIGGDEDSDEFFIKTLKDDPLGFYQVKRNGCVNNSLGRQLAKKAYDCRQTNYNVKQKQQVAECYKSSTGVQLPVTFDEEMTELCKNDQMSDKKQLERFECESNVIKADSSEEIAREVSFHCHYEL